MTFVEAIFNKHLLWVFDESWQLVSLFKILYLQDHHKTWNFKLPISFCKLLDTLFTEEHLLSEEVIQYDDGFI